MYKPMVAPNPIRDANIAITGGPSPRKFDATAIVIERALAALQDDPRRKEFQRLYDRLRRECGCALAGVLGLGATVTYVGIVAFQGLLADSIARSVGIVAMAPVVMILAAAAGKGIGIALARMRLRVLRERLTAYRRPADVCM